MAKVLSTTSEAPRWWASRASAAMSATRSRGLVGVSTHTSAVPSGHRRASAPGSSSGSTENVTPVPAWTRLSSRWVPP